MSHNFSQIRKLLSQKSDASRHRSVLIFAGDSGWQVACMEEILSGHEASSLWVGEQAPEIFPSISVKKAHSWLGREKQVVVFDANTHFNTDAFAAVTGIVVGGGLFILLMPATERWDNIYLSYFGQRLVQSINSTAELFVVRQTDKQINFSPAEGKKTSPHSCVKPFFTFEQQHVVEVIEAEVRNKSFNPVVINSDRGRGKSAALGIAAARLVNSGTNHIAITAPRFRSAEIIFKHIELLLPGAEIAQGKVIYKNRIIQFYSPDQLISADIKVDIVFTDEAAAIPVPVLTTILNKYQYCVFASTVHGYEGTGRGFALRFNTVLTEKAPGWKKCRMQTPVRWAENDPLEKWMFSLLCLDAEIVSPYSIGIIEDNKLEILCLSQFQIAQDETLLKEVFALLVLAHYRTQPSDLQRMLDDEQISLYIVKYNQHVLSVALVSHEGGFSDSLSTQVYRGERRPHGHLLAQALTYHCGVEHAATLNYARIMRIAVHPEYQQQGIGTKLINFVINNEKVNGCDAIGTSFGMNESLLHFWKKSHFNVVRIGFKREQTSGEHAAIMILPLSPQGENVKQEACSRFAGQLSYWFDDVLKDIPTAIKNKFIIDNSVSHILTQLDKEDLYSFIHYSRNYELCISALNKFVMSKQDEIMLDSFPDNFRKVLNLKVINKADWKDIGKEIALIGQDEARKLFQKAIIYLSI
ncbi:MAG: GNAT family N-acetyltransferase [Gammaproteobacteria bacterium]|nr:GNAT family N-acetyltransferase [Gammaproteobacteria bacterium]MCW8988222.1 GNAT family N-acetyltransferase [Gammaproteobacteria bacterium]